MGDKVTDEELFEGAQIIRTLQARVAELEARLTPRPIEEALIPENGGSLPLIFAYWPMFNSWHLSYWFCDSFSENPCPGWRIASAGAHLIGSRKNQPTHVLPNPPAPEEATDPTTEGEQN